MSKGMRVRLLQRIECLRETSAMYAERAAVARAAGVEFTSHKYARRASAIAWALDVVRDARPELFEPDEEADDAAGLPKAEDVLGILSEARP